MDELRRACAEVARRAAWVPVQPDTVPAYAAGLAVDDGAGAEPEQLAAGPLTREARAAFWLTLDAINFGSFPTLRKRDGRSGYHTIAAGVAERFATQGRWGAELAGIDGPALASCFGQDPGHPLLELFACSLRDLGTRVAAEHGGSFADLADACGGSAVGLARTLGRWPCFADCSSLSRAGAGVPRAGADRGGRSGPEPAAPPPATSPG